MKIDLRRGFVALIAGSCLLPGTAFAYIGPGAGLSAIGTAIAVAGAALLLVVGFIWYPVKRILRRRKSGETASSEPPDKEENKHETR